MKKLMIAALMTLVALTFFGCTVKDEVKQDKTGNQPEETIAKEFQPNLGGIKLGDSREQVIQAFGKDYKQTVFDEAFSLGEPFVKLHYSNGITVVLGSNSNSVLEIESNDPSISNNLGFKIGDKAQDVLNHYGSKYLEPESNQGEGKLAGWFLINAQQDLIIFDFDKDESWGNPNIKADALVERIRLTNFKYMD